MIKIFIWDIYQLPPDLVGLGPWLSLVATLIFWAVMAVLLRFVVFAVVRRLTQNTESEVDDVIMDALSNPLLMVVILFGLYNSLEELGFRDMIVDAVEKAAVVGIIITVAYALWRVVKEVVLYYGRQFAETSESNLDDVLLPIVHQLSPVVIVIGAALTALQYLGISLDSVMVAIGGASFILAFALQDILSNVFSGLSLVVDTPFAYRDLVLLADGTLCEVRRIGLRVTELYNVNTHAIIYVPNNQLANERLMNMTRPSPDLIDSIQVTVPDDTNLMEVQEMLGKILDGHPDILGELDAKIEQLPNFASLEAGEIKQTNGGARLRLEKQVNAKLNAIHAGLNALIQHVRKVERGGISGQERQALEKEFEHLLDMFGVKVQKTQTARGKAQWNSTMSLETNNLVGLVREWATVWACDPDLGGDENSRTVVGPLWDERLDNPLNDQELLIAQWSRRLRQLQRRLAALREKFDNPRGVEQRLDDLLTELASWLRRNFKEDDTDWKSPDVNFEGPNDKGYVFTLEFFIDDIELEHFERQERVRREIMHEVVRRFTEAGIRVPYPQMIMTFRPPLTVPADLRAAMMGKEPQK